MYIYIYMNTIYTYLYRITTSLSLCNHVAQSHASGHAGHASDTHRTRGQ